MVEIDVLIGIDGTHENKVRDMPPAEYDIHFKDSHVRHIVTNSRFRERSHYVRGPAGVGSYVNDRFLEALSYLERYAPGGDAIRLHLAGYSRGAAMALDLGNAFSIPPQGVLEVLKRLLAYGKSTDVVSRIAALRSQFAGRITVVSMALFDPVDMSSDIDADPIGRDIRNAAVTRRSQRWGSRLGWTNVGEEIEKPPAGPRPACSVIDGTHAALGGMPCTGDIPKALARDLLKQLTRSADWDRVERRYRQKPLEEAVVRSAMDWPGVFANPGNGGLTGAAAYISQQFNSKVSQKIADAALVQTYRRMLSSYANEGGSIKGSVSMGLNDSLGSFRGIDAYFLDFKDSLNTIAVYRQLDRKACLTSRKEMRRLLGNDYPAQA